MSRPAALPKTVLVGLARGGGQGEHASRRAGDGQLGLPCGRRTASSSTWPRPSCPRRPRRSICRSRWASWPAAGRSPSERLRRSTPSSASWPSTARTRPAQGRAVDGHGRRRAGRPARACSCPAESAAEAAVVEGIEVIAVASLAQAVGFLRRRDRDRAARLAARRTVPAATRTTTSTSPTSAARRWPSGPSPSPRPAGTIC